MGNITGEQVKSVIASYANNNSVLETAKETGMSLSLEQRNNRNHIT